MPAFLKQKRTLLIVVSLVVIALVAVAAFFVLTQTKSSTNSDSNNTAKINQSTQSAQTSQISSDVTWQWNGSEWNSSSKPPTCSTPLFTGLPVDISKVTAILYPGQTRGGDFKPHGGFRFGSDNTISVTAPLEASITSGSRYIEGGEVQYMFTFINPCGISYRFDHLHTLSEKFQKLADQLPEAKVDDTRTTPFDPPVKIEKGELIATKIGFVKTANVSVDFGVYDLSKTNSASQDPTFAQNYANEKELTFYGICWLKELPTEVSQKVFALPAGDSANGKTSDYC